MNKVAILKAIEDFEAFRINSLRGYDNFVDYIDSPRQYDIAMSRNNSIMNSVDEAREKLKTIIIDNGYNLDDLRMLCECQFTNPVRYEKFIAKLKPMRGVKEVLDNCQYYNRLRTKYSIFHYMSTDDKKLMLKRMNNVLLKTFNDTYKLGMIIRLDLEKK